MTGAGFDINTDAVVALTVKLNNLNRSAFPVAVRETLNQAAFDVKTRTLEDAASRAFIRRSPNFFKAFSGVNRAAGFDIATMKAEVGMTAMGKPTAQTAIRHMEIQESGGAIKEGADYLSAARGGSNTRKVSRSNYFNKNRLVNGPYKRKGTAKSRFIAAAFVAAREKKQFSVQTSRGRFLIGVSSISKLKKGTIKIRSRLVIQDRSHQAVRIKATHFANMAAMMTYTRMPEFYLKQAERRFERALRTS